MWAPNTKERISQIKQVQRRAACWTVSNFDRQVSVSKIVQDIGWRSLGQKGLSNVRPCVCSRFYQLYTNIVQGSTIGYTLGNSGNANDTIGKPIGVPLGEPQTEPLFILQEHPAGDVLWVFVEPRNVVP